MNLGFAAKLYSFLVSLMGYFTFPGLESLFLEAKFLKSTAATQRTEEHNASMFKKTQTYPQQHKVTKRGGFFVLG